MIRIYVSAGSSLPSKWRFVWGSYLIETISVRHTLFSKQLKSPLKRNEFFGAKFDNIVFSGSAHSK
jgi:hypothetical protein